MIATDNIDKKIVIASSNAGKIKELQDILSLHKCTIKSQSEYGVEDIEETGNSFRENAFLKAKNACTKTNLPTIADDSGLIVEALNGSPGVFSARYAGPNASDQQNIKKILRKLDGNNYRSATFHCIIVFLTPKTIENPLFFEGTWKGEIAYNPKGESGFGYDPIFYLPNQQKTAAELSPQQKNSISHRGVALKKFSKYIQDNLIF